MTAWGCEGKREKELLKFVIFFISLVNYFDYQMKLSCNEEGFTSAYLHPQNIFSSFLKHLKT